MTDPCRENHMAIQALLDGELAGPERLELEAHLAGCAGCRAYQASMAGLVGQLDGLKAPGRAPALDLEAILAPRPVVVPLRRKRAWAAWGAAAAAVLLAVGLSLPRAHGPVEVATTSSPPATVAELGDDGQAILTWFGPEADADDHELAL